jgi:hypothetical protein
MIEIPVDPLHKNIAIAISGGADSALLAYLICSKITDSTIHVINNIRCWKSKPWQQEDFKRVFNYLQNSFPHINFKVHTNFIPPELEWGDKGRTITDEYGKLVSGDTLELRAWAEYVCFQNKVESYYNGVTRNPKNVDFKGMPTRDIDPSDDNKHLELMMHMGFEAHHPFRFIDKGAIYDCYKDLDILELFELTRSCEGEFTDLNYKTYTPGQIVPVCNTCFWCKERTWSIEQSK